MAKITPSQFSPYYKYTIAYLREAGHLQAYYRARQNRMKETTDPKGRLKRIKTGSEEPINSSFTWAHTPEGSDFWTKLNSLTGFKKYVANT